MERSRDQRLVVADLSPVVYSAGRVFNELSTDWLATEKFLRTGSPAGIRSTGDLALLEDLRDIAQLIIDHGHARTVIDEEFVCAVNASITRSGALHPGQFRRHDQRIGVRTRYGIHRPPGIGDEELQRLIVRALTPGLVREQALNLFVAIAKAQPFEDANKRTALFVANELLLRENAGALLAVPLGEVGGTELSETFNDLLARAYCFDEDDGVNALLRDHGFVSVG